MSKINIITNKLEQFSKKFYVNELLKGSILFIAFGLLYLLFTLFIEHVLWLKPNFRTILFWLFISIELLLLVRFIGFPVFKLIGLQKGITKEDSSKIIGDHFPQVKDKLLNILQLQVQNDNSELLLASIEQKSEELSPIPFTKAINFKTNVKYLKFTLIPILIWLLILVLGKASMLTNTFKRVVNHDVSYSPPAPFSFRLTDKSLNVIQGESITIHVEIKGDVIPQDAKIIFDNQKYYLESLGNGLFTYTFDNVTEPIPFYITANQVDSKDYKIGVIKTPTIGEVSLKLYYPKYLNKISEIIKNTGNISVPEGTTVHWNVTTKETDSVSYKSGSVKAYFTKKDNGVFTFVKSFKSNTNYTIATSNKKISDFEKLQFNVSIIKDELPQINVKSNIDSITRGPALFAGQISDDNGFKSLSIVYNDINNPENPKIKSIKISKSNVQSFFYKFPNPELELIDGVDYELYFELRDNDVVNGFKKVTSNKFSFKKHTENEEKALQLNEQKDHIDKLSKAIQKQNKSRKDLKKVQFDLQNKKNMNWNDQKKVQNLVKRQQQYKKMMQRQTNKLQENFSEEKEKTASLQQKKEELQKRIEELKKLQKQEKLLDELQKMADKLKKDDLIKKAKELAEENKQQERSLERILEMTKQYYVEQKATQLSQKLEELAKKQEELINSPNVTKHQQEKIDKEFQEIKKDLEQLKKENEKLKNPIDIPSLEELKRDTDKQLKGAKQDLDRQNKSNAKEKQKKASKNMKEMGQKMKQSMESQSMEMQMENMEDLRFLLENLLTFSFSQEELMKSLSSIDAAHPNFAKHLKRQHQLKDYFEHIDDSLFALSIRTPRIATNINDKIAKTHYNIEQALLNYADNKFSNGSKNQQYVMTAVNELADMLSSTLDAMKNPMGGKGKGKGKGESFSLPDIIQKQSELLTKMKQQNQKKGSKGEKSESKKGKNGNKKDGQNGSKVQEKGGKNQGGTKGKNGNDGEPSDQMSDELYKIYQEQTRLREELEQLLNKQGAGGNKAGRKAIEEMKRLENKILENGFTLQNINRMKRLNHQLLKLKDASFEQGEKKERESITNLKSYDENSSKILEFKKKYLNHDEILDRKALPLNYNMKKRVQKYFMNQEKH